MRGGVLMCGFVMGFCELNFFSVLWMFFLMFSFVVVIKKIFILTVKPREWRG